MSARRRGVVAVLSLAAAGAIAAEPDADVVAAALRAAVRDAAEHLHFEAPTAGSPATDAPWHVRGKLVRIQATSGEAADGGLLAWRDEPVARVGVEIRVGGPTWDNTGFGGWRDGFVAAGVPVGLGPDLVDRRGLDLALWRASDAAYKDAVEQLARKDAQATPPPGHVADYEVGHTHAAAEPVVEAPTWSALRDTLVALSAAVGAGDGVDRSAAFLGWERGALWVEDTEGTSIRRGLSDGALRVVLEARAPDGQRAWLDRLWMFRDVDDLPSEEVLVEQARATAAWARRVASADPIEEEYVGPVLFEGEAAADLFRYLLLPQVLGTPAPIPFDTVFGAIGGGGGAARVGRRVLPGGWSVVDDPTATLDGPAPHPGAYRYDAEGTPAVGAEVVRDGVVARLLMTRTPRPGYEGTSTGHGRLTLDARAEARPTLSVVTPPRALPDAALRRAAIRAAAAYGRDWVLVVRHLQDPGVRTWSDRDGWVAASEQPLPPPVAVSRVYADGREELLRGARFGGVDRWVLRDLIAAGKPVVRDYYDATDGEFASLGALSGTPARITAPSVLVGELEVVPDSGDPRDQRALVIP
jgi:hypothetical protein